MQQLLQINALNANKLNVQRNWTSKVTDGTVAENPCTAENINFLKEIALSQENARKTH